VATSCDKSAHVPLKKFVEPSESAENSGQRVVIVDANAPSEVTQLLLAWNKGDRDALDRLMPLVYAELRRLARRHMRSEGSEHTLQPTVLVNEAYIRLVGQNRVNWQSRAHFFGAAAQIIRRVLVDHARGRGRLKRGGNRAQADLNDAAGASAGLNVDVVALDEALSQLAKWDPQKERIVELRFFAGLSIEETAETLGISQATVKREWAAARAWLYQEMMSS
jgi:RNA polymerase sigma factor (TIGR02999 family)